MTLRFRRAVSALGVVALAILLPTSTALAADVTLGGSGPYRGTVIRSIANDTTPGAAVPVSGYLMRDLGQSKSNIRLALKPTSCATTTTTVALDADELVGGRVRNDFKAGTALPFTEKRNGYYTIQLCINGQPALEQTFWVGFPAPVVTNVVATAAERAIAVTWDDMSSSAPDLRGYIVQRRLGASGDFAEIARVDAATPSYTDTDLPAEGGDASYRVIARRPYVEDSAPSSESTATYAALPPDSTVPGGSDAGTDTGTDTGVTVPGGSTGTTAPGGGTGGGTKPPTKVSPRHTSRVVIRAPRLGTPSNAFFPPLLTPPKATEVDSGYNPELPYDRESGAEDPVLPADELASSPTDELPGRGLAIPVATALVLAVWAFHLRYLARASKPVYLEDLELD